MIGRSVRRAVRRVCDRSNFSFRHLIFACIYAGWAASSSHQVLGVSRANRHFTHQDASANPRAIECPQQLAPRVVSVSMALPSPQCHQRPAFPAGRPSLSLRLSPFPSLSRHSVVAPPPTPPPSPDPHPLLMGDALMICSSPSHHFHMLICSTVATHTSSSGSSASLIFQPCRSSLRVLAANILISALPGPATLTKTTR